MPLGPTFRTVADAESIPPRTTRVRPADGTGSKISVDELLSLLFVTLIPFPEAAEAIRTKIRQMPGNMEIVQR